MKKQIKTRSVAGAAFSVHFTSVLEEFLNTFPFKHAHTRTHLQKPMHSYMLVHAERVRIIFSRIFAVFLLRLKDFDPV